MEERVEVRKECVLCKTTQLTCRLCAHFDEKGNCKYSVGLYLMGIAHGPLTYRGRYESSLEHYKNVEMLCL